MKILNLFKKLIKKEKVQLVPEKLTFSEIEKWLEKKIEENQTKEKQILILVKEKIKNFNSDLRTKIILLSEVDVESKKAEDKIKEIVNNSRAQYTEAVDNLITHLENLKETRFSDFTKKINNIFLDFNKKSFKNYERATILIGKEMASIKESLKVFSKNLLKTFDENKLIIDSFKNLLIIKEKLNTIIQINKILEKISEKKSNLNKKINEKEKENETLKQNLEEIKISPVYLEILSKQKKIKSLREESKKEILEFKQLLDFKALANFFHINKEQMNILKDHKENFHANFEKDNGKIIIELLDEAKLNNNIILEKINLIRIKIKETANHEKNLKKDETQELYYKIKEIGLEIDNLKIEKIREEKREEKIKTSKQELNRILEQELSKLNVEVV